MTDPIKQRAIDCYDAFTHGHRDRRQLMRELIALAGSAAAAEVLIAGIAASPAAAAIVPADDLRLKTARSAQTLAGKEIQGYSAILKERTAKPGIVLVLHENRGLTPHIEDVARRLALAGFAVVAPDFLSDQGGTPPDEDKARTMIEAADLTQLVAEAVEAIGIVSKATDLTTGKVGVVGFCWGGGLANRIAVAAGASLAAAVSYYGPAPDPAEAVKVKAAMLLHYAGLDTRVNATGTPWTAALKAAGVPVEAYTYATVNHAFNNDTAPDRYDKAAADLAWGRTLAFLHKRLDA